MDSEFWKYVVRYLLEFEVLLKEAKKRDQEGLLKNTFLSSDVGKVYMLLARALGRDIQAPGLLTLPRDSRLTRIPLTHMTAKKQRIIAAWLFAVAAMVFVMIVLGGVTRLTHSGLSMVDWRPLTGWLPPLDPAGWERVFARYQAYPEYQKSNFGMTLVEFKSIFWLEYAHRIWGRMIGVALLVPMVAFLIKGWIDRGLAPKLIGLLIFGGLQGVLGWFMVKSGLVDRPDVSQYRLAAHLALALAILGYLLWVALDLVHRQPPGPPPAGPAAVQWGGHGVQGLGRWAWGLLALIFVTALSGAFVAGLNAGLSYNTFPLMDGGLAPPGLFEIKPVYLNFFENIATVQFDHRLLAITVLVAVTVFWHNARKAPLTTGQCRAVNAVAAVAAVQVALGISTLLLEVPVLLAVLHQAGAVALLSAAVWLIHELRTG